MLGGPASEDKVEAKGGDPLIVKIARDHADLMDGLTEHKLPDLPNN
ncbi:MAG: hypothetical protein Q7K26_00530 [bacterium]|nr:hypothetical protein [bacterium]